jgi:hypothetical protein
MTPAPMMATRGPRLVLEFVPVNAAPFAGMTQTVSTSTSVFNAFHCKSAACGALMRLRDSTRCKLNLRLGRASHSGTSRRGGACRASVSESSKYLKLRFTSKQKHLSKS